MGMELNGQARRRIEDAILATVLGHQMGQASERRWWRMPPDGNEPDVAAASLTDEGNLGFLIDDPPAITTPGWGPTGFEDTVPHLCMLGAEYARLGRALSPEDFRDFLLRERPRMRLQGVGRSCVELMAEGMNPRISGLYAASVASGCWPAWPAALYRAGNASDAYEDAVRLTRAQSGGDIVVLSGLLSAMLATAVVPGAAWEDVRAALLRLTEKRGRAVYKTVELALCLGGGSATQEDWLRAMRSPDFTDRVCVFGAGIDWMTSWYAAVSALEFAYRHNTGWPAFAAGVLSACHSRFGAMIAFSVRAALDGLGAAPPCWVRHAAAVHGGEVRAWGENAAAALGVRLSAGRANAGEILGQLDGETEDTRLFDKVLAVMLAGAAGNVMGSPVEDRDYPWIAERYGVLEHILEPKRLDTEDDSAMAAMWAETYVRCQGRITPEDLAETFRARMAPHNFYYDTQHAYNLLMGGLPPHACGHWNVVTGSGLMGSYPCGVYHAGDPSAAAADGLELAYHYQRGFDVHAPAILCAATAEALREGATVETVLEAAVAAAPAEPQHYFGCVERRDARAHLRRALKAVEGCGDVLAARDILYRDFLEYNGQDPWEVVTLTLAIFKVCGGDVWQAMVGGTNIGRDSDTISSQAALLSAALRGMAGVPQAVLALFSEPVLANYRKMAGELAALVRRKCLRALDDAARLGSPL